MKKIVLKMSDLILQNERYGKLKYASLYTLEGEVNAFLGLNDSGKELAVQILLGTIELDWNESKIYVDGCKIRRASDLYSLVTYVNTSHTGIENWSVAEYISLKDVSWFLTKRQKNKLIEEAKKQLKEMQVELDIRKKIKNLTPLEYRIVELIKARRQNARILIIEDECEGMDAEAIETYAQFLKKIIKDRMTAILLCHSDRAVSLLSDNYIIFRRGRVVKKWKKEFAYNQGNVEDYLLGGTMIRKKSSLDSYSRKSYPQKNVVYKVFSIPIYDRCVDFEFRKGEITTFIITNNTERRKFFSILSGRLTPPETVYEIKNKKRYMPPMNVFVEHKIVSVMRTGNDYEMFEKMSVGDNLILPSLKKVPLFNYMVSGNKLKQILGQEMEMDSLGASETIGHLDKNHHISVSMNRWYVFNPQVIVLYEPFTSCDAYGVSIILSYIKKMADRGTAVIVVRSNSEYMEETSDHIIDLDV